MLSRSWRSQAIICLGFLGIERSACAQTNSWTNTVSGYWEQPYWSLGVLPATNTALMFTNYGWKALAIGPETTQNYPQTLNIGSLTISSPTNSYNVLLMNYAGLQTPLVIGDWRANGSLLVGSNSAVVMYYSSLLLSNQIAMGREWGAFSIGGTFDQAENSEVAAGFVNVGDIGPGVYNLTNGVATIGREHIGGNFPASFNQFGGTNLTSITGLNPLCPSCVGLQLSTGGQYNLYDGYFEGSVSFQNASFTQYGGIASASLDFINGTYQLAGGTFFAGGLAIPQYPNCSVTCENSASFIQTGGTNYAGSIMMNGVDADPLVAGGSYSLAYGYLFAGEVSVGPGCAFSQSGGVNSNAGISLAGTYVLHGPRPAYFTLSGGQLSTPGISVSFGSFTQYGGTNQVSGDINLIGTGYGASQYYSLSGGQLSESNLTVIAGPGGAHFTQDGGVHSIANQLMISGQLSCDFTLRGGVLSVPNIVVASGARFHQVAGALNSAGTVTLALGTWDEQAGGQQFGPLQLGFLIQNYYSGGTNSTLSFPSNSCVLRFANSATTAWTNNTALFIEDWNGSWSGGGKHQLLFGLDSTGLKPTQLRQILFHNPAGTAGMYPAMILASGEVVPRRSLGIQTAGSIVLLEWGGNLLLETSTNVLGPYQVLTNAVSPYTAPMTNPAQYFRLGAP